MNTIAIIIAAGESKRWNNYLGVSKNFIKIEGEKLLNRLVRLIKEKSPETKIYVVGKNENYRVEGAELYIPKLNPDNFGVDKFLSSKELWNKEGKTLVFYGDVWYSDEAIKTIFEYQGQDWTLFARFGGSKYTGCSWGECFCQSFYPKDIEKHENKLYELLELIKSGKIHETAGGWEHYCLMEGFDFFNRQKGKSIYEIDDFTEDFDFPFDYERWLDYRRHWSLRGVEPTIPSLFTFCGVFRNEAQKVRYVLDIGKYLCGAMIVAVQESNDGTEKICSTYPCNVLKHPHQGPEESKDLIMEKVNTPWTLWLDADEMPSLGMIHFIETFNPEEWEGYDAIKFPRINYINGMIVEANKEQDEQFRILRDTVRWNPKGQGRGIHIHPQVKNPARVDFTLYHHRSLDKIIKQTKNWNELEPSLTNVCNRYVEDVKKGLSKKNE